MLELYVVVADCATSYEPGGGAFVQPTALVLPSWHQVTDGVKNAEVLAVKGPLRPFAPLTAPSPREKALDIRKRGLKSPPSNFSTQNCERTHKGRAKPTTYRQRKETLRSRIGQVLS